MTNENNEYTLGGKHKFRVIEKEEEGKTVKYAEYENGNLARILCHPNFGEVVVVNINENNPLKNSYVGRFTDCYKAIIDGDAHFMFCTQMEHYKQNDKFYTYIPIGVYYSLESAENQQILKRISLDGVNETEVQCTEPRYALLFHLDSSYDVSKAYYLDTHLGMMINENEGELMTFDSQGIVLTALYNMAQKIKQVEKLLDELYKDYPEESPETLSQSVSNIVDSTIDFALDEEFYSRLQKILDCAENEGHDMAMIYSQAEGLRKFKLDHPSLEIKDWYKAFLTQFEIVELPDFDEDGKTTLWNHKEEIV